MIHILRHSCIILKEFTASNKSSQSYFYYLISIGKQIASKITEQYHLKS